MIINCPHCLQEITVEDADSGKMECPLCHGHIQVERETEDERVTGSLRSLGHRVAEAFRRAIRFFSKKGRDGQWLQVKTIAKSFREWSRPSTPGSVKSGSPPDFRGVTSGQATAIIVILVLGMFVFPFFRSAFEQVSPAQEWEYKIVSVADSSFDYQVNDYGKRGWELVFARRASDGNTSFATFSYEMIFKRPKKL